MDKLPYASRSTASVPCFEHLPQDVLQHILHYLPIKGARNVFRLLTRGHLASSDYLRVAGLVQARIRSHLADEKQARASERFASLLNDCMDPRLPAGTTMSLLVELGNLLSTLSTSALPSAMRTMLFFSKRLGEKAGKEFRETCMERCIRTYQRRSETDAQLPKFEPIDDEEAALAARHFSCDFQPFLAPPEQILSQMENLHAALAWTAKVANADERVRLLARMCRHGVTTFALFNQMDREVRDGGLEQRAQALRASLPHTAMQLLPAQAVEGQVALISLALEVSVNDRSMYRLAVSAGRHLLKHMPESALPASWPIIARGLFRAGLVKALIQRASAWPEPQGRAAMLGQIASAAFDKGALKELDSLCAMINELAPPKTAPLYELIERHANARGTARAEVVMRELIPPLMALPAGLEKCALIAAASAFIFAPLKHAPGTGNEFNTSFLMGMCLESYKKLITNTFSVPVAADQLLRRQLLALADALMEQAAALPSGASVDSQAAMKVGLMALLSPLAAKIASQ
jgi:hypothetical protein